MAVGEQQEQRRQLRQAARVWLGKHKDAYLAVGELLADRDRCKAALETSNGALREVMEWIDSWDPALTDDPEWHPLEARVRELLQPEAQDGAREEA